MVFICILAGFQFPLSSSASSHPSILSTLPVVPVVRRCTPTLTPAICHCLSYGKAILHYATLRTTLARICASLNPQHITSATRHTVGICTLAWIKQLAVVYGHYASPKNQLHSRVPLPLIIIVSTYPARANSQSLQQHQLLLKCSPNTPFIHLTPP